MSEFSKMEMLAAFKSNPIKANMYSSKLIGLADCTVNCRSIQVGWMDAVYTGRVAACMTRRAD